MNKYGVKDTFDLMFRDGGEVVLFIDTAKEVTLISTMGRNKLIVRDALVDVKLINDIFSGKFDQRLFSVKGSTSFRDVNTGEDRRVNLDIKELEFKRYELPTGMDVSVVTLQFEFDTWVGLAPNLTLKVEENEDNQWRRDIWS